MTRISLKRRLLNLLSDLPPIFGDHHLPFVLAAVSIIYGIVVSVIGEHYASFLLELTGMVLLFLGTLAIRLSPAHMPGPLAHQPRQKPLPPIQIPSPTPYRNKGIELVHEYFIGSGLIALAKRILYPDTSLIRRSVMRRAFEKNPYSGFVVQDRQENIRGLIEMWSINDEKLDALLRGEIKESDLEEGDFSEYDENIKRFYVAITIPSFTSNRGIKNAETDLLKLALNGVVTTMEKAYNAGPGKKIIFNAIDATEEGKNAMIDLGFEIDETLSAARGDRRHAWRLRIDSEYIKFLREKFKISQSYVRFLTIKQAENNAIQ